MEEQIKIEVQGNVVIQTTSTSLEFNKEEYLANKERELEEHNAGVEAYLVASNLKKEELENIIKSLR